MLLTDKNLITKKINMQEKGLRIYYKLKATEIEIM